MDTASRALKRKLRSAESQLPATITQLVSPRHGEHFMDGNPVLNSTLPLYVRPWNDCIPLDELSVENLPPFYVRLRDDQVGHLLEWFLRWDAFQNGPNLPRGKRWLSGKWPWDFTSETKIASRRESWGPAYNGCNESAALVLKGRKELPEYVNPGLPLTNTSSDKPMRILEWIGESNDIYHSGALEGPILSKDAEAATLKSSYEGAKFTITVQSELLTHVSRSIDCLQKILRDRTGWIEEAKSGNAEKRRRLDDVEVEGEAGAGAEASDLIDRLEHVLEQRTDRLEELEASKAEERRLAEALSLKAESSAVAAETSQELDRIQDILGQRTGRLEELEILNEEEGRRVDNLRVKLESVSGEEAIQTGDRLQDILAERTERLQELVNSNSEKCQRIKRLEAKLESGLEMEELARIKRVEEILGQRTDKIEELGNDYADNQQKIQKLERKNAELESANNEQRVHIETLEAKLEASLKPKSDTESSTSEQCTAMIRGLGEANAQKLGQIKRLEERLADVTEKADVLEAQARTMETKQEYFDPVMTDGTIRILRQDLESRDKRIKQLEQRIIDPNSKTIDDANETIKTLRQAGEKQQQVLDRRDARIKQLEQQRRDVDRTADTTAMLRGKIPAFEVSGLHSFAS